MDALAFLGHGEGGQGFHAPLRAAILRYARDCNQYGGRDDEALKARLRAAIRSAPCRPGGDVEHPYCQDHYLGGSISGAFALLAAEPDIQAMRPHHEAPRHTVDEARAAATEHISGFISRALAWHRLAEEGRVKRLAEHAALVIDVGVGKSTAARRGLSAFVEPNRADRLPHRVLHLAQTHRLGGEAQAAMAELGLNVAVWRGRDADEPGTGDPEYGLPPQKMCLNLPAVEDALLIGQDVERAVCGSGKEGEPSCPFRNQCAYQKQKAAVAKADVVIAAHQSLFHRLPQEVSHDLGLVIVDEAWWQAGLQPNRTLRLAGFSEEPILHPVLQAERDTDGKPSKWERLRRNEEDTNDLGALSARAEAAFAATPNGELVSKAAATAAGLTATDCAHAVKLEWRRKVDGVLHPGMSPAARKSALEAATGNVTLPRRVAVWEALRALLAGGDEQTGRLQMGTKSDAEGAARVILLHSRMEIRDNIAGLPMLSMDATMPVEVVRRYLPRLNVLAQIRAATPNMRVHQITGGWGKTSLVPSDRATPEENRRRGSRVGELADFVRLNSGGDALAVTYQAIEPRFAAEGVRTGHFNAIAGLDAYRDVRSLFVIGRPLPDARELRALALALTGRPIPAEGGQVETRGALMADGTGQAVKVRAYADPDLEALRVAITESEVLQAIGRGRGVNRGANSPLDVFVFADMALPLPAATLSRWEDIRPTVLERMLARGCVLLGPTDAAKAYPDLFASSESAKKAMARELAGRDFGDIPLRVLLLRGMSPKSLAPVTYRPTGRGQQTRKAWAPPSRLPALREWLESRVGPLAHYAVGPPSPPPPPPSQTRPPLTLGVSLSMRAAGGQAVPEADPGDWRSEFDLDEELGCGPAPDAASMEWPWPWPQAAPEAADPDLRAVEAWEVGVPFEPVSAAQPLGP